MATALQLMLASLSTQAIAADTTVPAGRFDVAGVHLGMTPAEATQALKAYDPHLVIQANYDCGMYNLIPREECAQNRQPVAVLAEYRIAKPEPTVTAQGYRESIIVAFLTVPGKERVVSVGLIRNYFGNREPPYEVLKRAVVQKFPADALSDEQLTALYIGYFISKQGHELESQLRREGLVNIRSALIPAQIPGEVHSDKGVSYKARVGNTQGLASGLEVSLYDEVGMFAAAMQHSVIVDMNNKAKTQDANKNAGNIKF
jgi:hypothetical protein